MSTETPQTPQTPKSASFFDANSQTLEQETPNSSTSTLDSSHVSSARSTTPTPSIRVQAHHALIGSVPLNGRKGRGQRSFSFMQDSSRLIRQLAPLLSIETGVAHPHFPRTMLQYSVLTEAELDDLAHFYHQRSPNQFSMQYPMPVVSRWNASPTPEELEAIDDAIIKLRAMLGLQTTKEDLFSLCRVNGKRRRFGRFIGLKGMESAGLDMEGMMREEMEWWVERAIRRREARDSEVEMWRSKGL